MLGFAHEKHDPRGRGSSALGRLLLEQHDHGVCCLTDHLIGEHRYDATSASPSASPSSAYPFKGYPKVVPASDVPDQMQNYVDGSKMIAVAPGVWTQYVFGVSAKEAASDGAFIGYCAAVAKARELHSHNGSTCW